MSDPKRFAARLVLGSVLVAAGVAKAGDTTGTILALGAHLPIPGALVYALGCTLPGVETACGMALLVGYRVRAAGLLAASLFGAFAATVALALARSVDAPCGCLGPLVPQISPEPSLAAFDASMMALALWCARRGPRPPPPS